MKFLCERLCSPRQPFHERLRKMAITEGLLVCDRRSYRHHVSCGDSRHQDVLLSRLLRVRLSAGLLWPRKLLAGAGSALESTQQLRDSISGSVEHFGVLPALGHLPVISAAMVFELLLLVPSLARRRWHVFPGTPIDR